MKKWIALALAMLMMLTSAAIAETARITISNPVITESYGGDSQSVDLTGLAASLSAGLSGQVPTLQATVTGDGQTLLDAVAQIGAGRIYMDMEGLSHTYFAPLQPAQMASQAQEALAGLIGALPRLVGTKLPAFRGTTLPKLDLLSFGSLIGARSNGSTATFSYDYRTINMLLRTVSPYLRQFANGMDVSQITGIIDQLANSNSGINLEGEITDTGAEAALTLRVYPVESGSAMPDPALEVRFTSRENNIGLALMVDEMLDGNLAQVANISLVSEPAAAKLSFTMNLMGQVEVYFRLYPTADGLQAATLSADAMGEGFDITFTYGDLSGVNVTDLALSAAGTAIALRAETISAADGSHGTLMLSVDESYGSGIAISGDLDVVKGISPCATCATPWARSTCRP